MTLTKIAQQIFRHRRQRIALYATDTADIQRRVLNNLVAKAKETEYGRVHHFDSIHTYDDFARLVPLATYEDLKGDIDCMRRGERDVLWPGQVVHYAKSSGTTNDKSKFIPVSREGLKDIHYRGGTDVVVLYLAEHPESRLFDGKSLILGGSHTPNYNTPNSIVGDLSAILIENINPLMRPFWAIRKSTALLADFEVKRDQIARELIARKHVTSLSGVPSWMLSVLIRALEISGKETIDRLLPDLEVFFHGGISFVPYRPQYERIIRKPGMTYMETYNASEGFFGIQDCRSDTSMLLMVDYGVFYEFCPTEYISADGRVEDMSRVVPIEGTELNRNYAMIITTNCGLWRYVIGDTVKFTSVRPYKFIITGRIKSFINAFGEELIVDNADKGLQAACEATGAEVADYTAAPIYMNDDGQCRHQWLIEFAKEPADVRMFAAILDRRLQQLNSDYEAKRYKNITLQPLEIVVARRSLFNDWLKGRGKLGGQHKIPRLSNSRTIIDKLLEMNAGKG
ncbi:MAG: GH3 auxin-responsive promoter family protein [Prevotella sp.]|nr:GH3 auxin-responsive promoter family protein [Prevotella sp.]